jgi:sodium/bile acid cotransporter 7
MFKRYWFLIALTVVLPMGYLWPEGGIKIRQAGFIVPVLVATTLLVSGFTLDTSRLLGQIANLPVILLGLGTTYGVAPVLAYLLARLWGPEITGQGSIGFQFVEAVMILAAQAGTLASAMALTSVARGNQEIALILTVLSNSLTAVLTPAILNLSVGVDVEFPLGTMVSYMALVVLLPVLLGQVLRRFLWKTAQPILKQLKIVPQLIILVFVYTSFGGAAGYLLEASDLLLRFAGTCVCLHLLLLAWTYGISSLMGLPQSSRTAVVFCGSQKTLPNAIYLWDHFFASNPYGAIPMVLYHIFQLVLDTLLVPWLEPQTKPSD